MFETAFDYKNFFSLLVGYTHNCKLTEEYQKYIITMYESFPSLDEKDYADAWYRFFDVCSINDINKEYFLRYKKHFSDSKISYLLEKRCSIVLEQTVVYKTINQLLKAVRTIGLTHLKENHAVLHELFKKKGVKEKFWSQVEKEYGVQSYIVNDYLYFISFCDEFGFDRITVLQNLTWYEFGYFFCHAQTLLNEFAELFYADVAQIEKTTELTKRLFIDQPSTNPCHIILIRFGRMHNDRIDLLYKHFKNEIIEYMSYKMNTRNRYSIMEFNPLLASHWKARFTEYVGAGLNDEKVNADIVAFIEKIK